MRPAQRRRHVRVGLHVPYAGGTHIHIELINGPFLQEHRGSPADYNYLAGGGLGNAVSIRAFHVPPSRTSVAVQRPELSRGAPLSFLPVA